MSGSLFAIDIDPFVRCLHHQLPSATRHAFADYIASVFRKLSDLPQALRLFDVFEKIFCLKLKYSKVVVMPLGRSLLPEVVVQGRESLSMHDRRCNDVRILPCAKIARVYMRP